MSARAPRGGLLLAGLIACGVALAFFSLYSWLAPAPRLDPSPTAAQTPGQPRAPSSPEIPPRTSDPAGLPKETAPPRPARAPAAPTPLRATPRQRALAGEFGGLLAGQGDPGAWVLDNFETPASSDWLDESLEFIRPKVGACGEPSPMAVVGDRRARFLYPCEHGGVEATLLLSEDGHTLAGLLLGARDVEPNPAVRRAAEVALALVETWDLERFQSTFGPDFDADPMREFFAAVRLERGLCSLESVDVATAQGALWFVECENGPALMKVNLDNQDRVRRFWIRERRRLRPEPS